MEGRKVKNSLQRGEEREKVVQNQSRGLPSWLVTPRTQGKKQQIKAAAAAAAATSHPQVEPQRARPEVGGENTQQQQQQLSHFVLKALLCLLSPLDVALLVQ